MTARRQFGAAIVACAAGAGLVLLALRQVWAHVDYTAPRPLPSGSIPVSGQDLLPAAGALALAALACLAAVVATRGLARRVVGVALAGLGAWIAVLVSEPVSEATVLAAASGQAASGGLAGSLPGGNSAISGGVPSGGGLPAIGQASRVVLASGPWRAAALIGAVAVIAAGLAAAWRGPRWAVMSGRFDQPARSARPEDGLARSARPQDGPAAPTRPEDGLARLARAQDGPAAPARGAVRAADAAAPSRPVPGDRSAAPASGSVPTAWAATPGSQPSAPAPQDAAPGSQARAPGSQPPAPGSQPPAPGSQGPAPGSHVVLAGEPGAAGPGRAETGARARHPDGDAAALWEALDRGVDLTDAADDSAEPVTAPAQAEEP